MKWLCEHPSGFEIMSFDTNNLQESLKEYFINSHENYIDVKDTDVFSIKEKGVVVSVFLNNEHVDDFVKITGISN